jgi:hypothetical protein
LDRNAGFWEYVSLIGSYSSLFGLFVMFIQFRSVRKTTEETRTQLERLGFLVDLSKAHELVRSVESDIERDEMYAACYKLKLVKDFITKSAQSSISEEGERGKGKTKKYESVENRINSYISVLNQYVMENESEDCDNIDKKSILNGLEKIVDFLNKQINQQQNKV